MEDLKIDYTFEEVWREIVDHEAEGLAPDWMEIDYWRSFATDLKGFSTYKEIVENGLYAAFYAVIFAKVSGHMKSSSKGAFHDKARMVSRYLRPKTIELTPEIADEFIDVVHILTENKIKEVNDFFDVFKPVLKDCENALNMFKAEYYANSSKHSMLECTPLKDKGVFVDRVRTSKALHPAHELCELAGLDTEYLLMFNNGYSLDAYSYLEENILDFSKFECVRKSISDYVEGTVSGNINNGDLGQYATDSRKEGSDLFLDRYNLIPYLSLKDIGNNVQLSFGINQEEFNISTEINFNKKSFYDGKLKIEGNSIDDGMRVISRVGISSIMGCMVYAVNVFSKKHPGVPIDEVVVLPFASENTCGLGQCSLWLSDEDSSVTVSSKYKKNHCRVVVAVQ